MTKKELLKKTLNLENVGGHVPTFEISMFLTLEAVGKVHPKHRNYSQWNQTSPTEKNLIMKDMAETYILTAEKFDYSAIFVNYSFEDLNDQIEFLRIIKELSNGEYMLLMHGGATYGIPDGSSMEEFCYLLVDEPERMLAEAQQKVDNATARAEKLLQGSHLDGFIHAVDYAFNTGPFMSLGMFDEFVTPYLIKIIKNYKDMGYNTIAHTDGNIMPLMDRIVEAAPQGLQSIDPQGGMDIAEVKRLYGDKLCLMGNVNCGLMQTGTDEEVVESARYALKHGMSDGKGYIFSTSNTVYTGMELSRYQLIWDIWKKEGIYS